jgi:hypothetical protein
LLESYLKVLKSALHLWMSQVKVDAHTPKSDMESPVFPVVRYTPALVVFAHPAMFSLQCDVGAVFFNLFTFGSPTAPPSEVR